MLQSTFAHIPTRPPSLRVAITLPMFGHVSNIMLFQCKLVGVRGIVLLSDIKKHQRKKAMHSQFGFFYKGT